MNKKEWLDNRVRFETEQDAILERRVINYLLKDTDLEGVKLGENDIDFAVNKEGKTIAYVEVKGSCMKQTYSRNPDSDLKHMDSVWLSVKKLCQVQYAELVNKRPTFVVYPFGSGEVLYIRYHDIQGMCRYRGMKPREGSTHDMEMIISISKRKFTIYDPEPPNFLQELCKSQ